MEEIMQGEQSTFKAKCIKAVSRRSDFIVGTVYDVKSVGTGSASTNFAIDHEPGHSHNFSDNGYAEHFVRV
jgi:hypothetical protein